MKRYVLKRTLPSGAVKRHSPQNTARAAALSAGRVLFDNGVSPKAEAQGFSFALCRLPYGQELTHYGSGYRFVIETVTEEA